ncbi:uncharacterized protein TNCV_1470441 [Trichonephila clavipes]|nr:uncharacterized protein TNCV_1470441 [Trichonephila clavipes]
MSMRIGTKLGPFAYHITLNLLAKFRDSTRGLLATDHVILNHGQVTWTTPELALPLLTTAPHHWVDVSALDRFNVHRCPTQRVFSGTGLELVTKQATVRYLYHSATAATGISGRCRRRIGEYRKTKPGIFNPAPVRLDNELEYLKACNYEHLVSSLQTDHYHLSDIVVSVADCVAVGSGFESRVRHGCLCRNPSLLCDVCFTLTSM